MQLAMARPLITNRKQKKKTNFSKKIVSIFFNNEEKHFVEYFFCSDLFVVFLICNFLLPKHFQTNKYVAFHRFRRSHTFLPFKELSMCKSGSIQSDVEISLRSSSHVVGGTADTDSRAILWLNASLHL
jgi:hypothetical protein